MWINSRFGGWPKVAKSQRAKIKMRMGSVPPEIQILKSRNEIAQATKNLRGILVSGHHDSQKNWDLDLASQKLLLYPRKINILDAGSGSKAVFAKSAVSLGYRNVYACDLQKSSVKGVKSSVQDISRTNYDSGFFQFISCLSVIEHGVNLESFFREMYRIASDNSFLCLTTDFWPVHEEHSNKFPYGEDNPPMKLFNNDSIFELLELASDSGWQTPNYIPIQEFYPRPIRWERMNAEYTFIFVGLSKSERSPK